MLGLLKVHDGSYLPIYIAYISRIFLASQILHTLFHFSAINTGMGPSRFEVVHSDTYVPLLYVAHFKLQLAWSCFDICSHLIFYIHQYFI